MGWRLNTDGGMKQKKQHVRRQRYQDIKKKLDKNKLLVFVFLFCSRTQQRELPPIQRSNALSPLLPTENQFFTGTRNDGYQPVEFR